MVSKLFIFFAKNIFIWYTFFEVIKLKNEFKIQYQSLVRNTNQYRQQYLGIASKYSGFEGDINSVSNEQDREAMKTLKSFLDSDTFKLQVMQGLMPYQSGTTSAYSMKDVLNNNDLPVYCDATNSQTGEHFINVCGSLVSVESDILRPQEYQDIYTSSLNQLISEGKITQDMLTIDPNVASSESELDEMFSVNQEAQSLYNSRGKSL